MKWSQKGFSLPELLVAVSLSFIIVTAAFYSYQSFNRFSLQHQDVTDMQLELEMATKEISYYLNMAGYGLEKGMAFTVLQPNVIGIQIKDPNGQYCLSSAVTEIRLSAESKNSIQKDIFCDGVLKSAYSKVTPFAGVVSFKYLNSENVATSDTKEVRWVELDLESVRYRDVYPDTLSKEMAMRVAPRNLLL